MQAISPWIGPLQDILNHFPHTVTERPFFIKVRFSHPLTSFNIKPSLLKADEATANKFAFTDNSIRTWNNWFSINLQEQKKLPPQCRKASNMQLQYITFETNCKIFHFSIKAQINKTWNTTHFYFPGHSKVWWWSTSNFHLQINLFILIKITKWDSFHTRNFPFFGPLFKHTFSAVSKAVFPRRKESLEVNTWIHLFSNSYSDLFLHLV